MLFKNKDRPKNNTITKLDICIDTCKYILWQNEINRKVKLNVINNLEMFQNRQGTVTDFS